MITTAWSGGVTGGEQIAFASLRLIALRRGIEKRIERIAAGQVVEPNGWFGSLPSAGTNAASHAANLSLVNRAIVWGDRTYANNRLEFDLEGIVLSSGVKDVGEDLLKTAREKATAWKKERGSAVVSPDLTGPQLWDILPECRFQFVHEQGPVAEAKIFVRPDDVKEHQPSRTYFRPALISYGSKS